MSPRDQHAHAVVIGASLAGLFAARTLSDHFAQVTVLERDRLDDAQARRGVAHAQHLHGLLAGGVQAVEQMFPGFVAGAREAGALTVDVGEFATWYIDGVALPAITTGLEGLLMGRPLLEQHVRERLRAHANVTLQEGVRVTALRGSAWHTEGVALMDADGAERVLDAQLVVDASGRGSLLPDWLVQLGLQAPKEDRVQMDLTYTSCLIRRKRSDLAGKLGYLYAPTSPHRRMGAALAIEGDRYIVTLMGYLGERAPRNYAGMIAYAKTLPVSGLYELLRDAEPLTPPVQLRDAASVRRRYEQLKHLPRGLLAIGDSLASLNPSYGHGMTVAALEALALGRLLASGTRDLSPAFFDEAARIIDVPWSMVVGADFEFPGVTGTIEPPPATIRAYFKRALRAAGVDRAVALAVYRVMHLIAPPTELFSPEVMASVLAHGDAAPSSSFVVMPERS